MITDIDIFDLRKDKAKINEFIESYMPFIAKSVYSFVGRPVEYGVDEELSIGLLAFNEAIEKFNGKSSFISFAKLVINRRLLDYYKTSKKNQIYESIETEEHAEIPEVISLSVKRFAMESEAYCRREEIAQFNQMLRKHDISLNELLRVCPKHKEKRDLINKVSNFILSNQQCYFMFIEKGQLNLKYIEEHLHIPRKKIEPYRKYIIAIILLKDSDLTMLKDYLGF